MGENDGPKGIETTLLPVTSLCLVMKRVMQTAPQC